MSRIGPFAARLEQRRDHRLADGGAARIAQQAQDDLLLRARHTGQRAGGLRTLAPVLRSWTSAPAGLDISGPRPRPGRARPGAHAARAGSACARRPRSSRAAGRSARRRGPASRRSAMILCCGSESRAMQARIASRISGSSGALVGQRARGGLQLRPRGALAHGRADRVGGMPLRDAGEPGARVDGGWQREATSRSTNTSCVRSSARSELPVRYARPRTSVARSAR